MKESQIPVKNEDLAQFYVNYMENDQIAKISNVILASLDPHGDVARELLDKLGVLHRIAVDYPKNGVPVNHSSIPIPESYPHYMEKEIERQLMNPRGSWGNCMTSVVFPHIPVPKNIKLTRILFKVFLIITNWTLQEIIIKPKAGNEQNYEIVWIET